LDAAGGATNYYASLNQNTVTSQADWLDGTPAGSTAASVGGGGMLAGAAPGAGVGQDQPLAPALEPLVRARVGGVEYRLPAQLGVVEDGVYRCAFPPPATFPFLAKLKLRTVSSNETTLCNHMTINNYCVAGHKFTGQVPCRIPGFH
jgi:hypothetical protein